MLPKTHTSKPRYTLKYISALFKDFVGKHKEKIAFLGEFLFVVLFYGILLNLVYSFLSGGIFSVKIIIALGILAYLVKAELPQIISACFPRAPKPPVI
jgi:hypothetical protein